MENNKNKDNLVLSHQDYFKSQAFKIPKEVKLEIVSRPKNTKSEGDKNGNTSLKKTHPNHWEKTSSLLLQCTGPLGTTLIDLEKFDKFGLCFFQLKQHQIPNAENKEYLEVSIKTLLKKKAHTSEIKLESFLSNGALCSGVPPISGELSKKSSAFFQLFSSLYKQTIEGVTQGYVNYLELHGVGFRAQFHEKKELNCVKKYIEFKLGQSHDILYEIPNSIQAFLVKPTMIGLYGIDKEKVTHIGAQIRHLKLPDPYKGKGIRLKDEHIQTKIGKKK